MAILGRNSRNEITKTDNICELCGSTSNPLRLHKKFSHIKSLTHRDATGKSYKSGEAIFRDEKELCVSCYNNAVQAEKRAYHETFKK